MVFVEKLESVINILQVPTMHRTLGTDGGSIKLWGLQPPSHLAVPSLKANKLSANPQKQNLWLLVTNVE